MKKLAAISTAISIFATVQGIGQPASANQIHWRSLGYDTSGTTSFLYDENSVSRSGDVFAVRVSANGNVGFLGLSCSRGTFTTSPNGKGFGTPRPIAPRSAAATLYGMFCHSDYNQQISDHNQQMNQINGLGNAALGVSEKVK